MLRPISRSIPWRAARPLTFPRPRRTLSTAPPSQTSRSWKNSALRWGLAFGGIYYYNTSNAFAEEPTAYLIPHQVEPPHDDGSDAPTVEAISAERRRRISSQLDNDGQRSLDSEERPLATQPERDNERLKTAQETEEEADSEGAFNPETGEINWDCPCLGGMAHGPCGPEFRNAFSCFVYSTDEPKGMDCIDKFKGMQDCFRQHPDVYGTELDEDEENEEANANNAGGEKDGSTIAAPSPSLSTADPASLSSSSAAQGDKEQGKDTTSVTGKQEPQSESETLVPKSAHDKT
ncbi:MAG: Oxidoreductase [Sclerophora amabilis]|nr:MAG: Oxidoreductase [Sclerophora amabilis]